MSDEQFPGLRIVRRTLIPATEFLWFNGFTSWSDAFRLSPKELIDRRVSDHQSELQEFTCDGSTETDVISSSFFSVQVAVVIALSSIIYHRVWSGLPAVVNLDQATSYRWVLHLIRNSANTRFNSIRCIHSYYLVFVARKQRRIWAPPPPQSDRMTSVDVDGSDTMPSSDTWTKRGRVKSGK